MFQSVPTAMLVSTHCWSIYRDFVAAGDGCKPLSPLAVPVFGLGKPGFGTWVNFYRFSSLRERLSQSRVDAQIEHLRRAGPAPFFLPADCFFGICSRSACPPMIITFPENARIEMLDFKGMRFPTDLILASILQNSTCQYSMKLWRKSLN